MIVPIPHRFHALFLQHFDEQRLCCAAFITRPCIFRAFAGRAASVAARTDGQGARTTF
jgi:hypothetical protein